MRLANYLSFTTLTTNYIIPLFAILAKKTTFAAR